MRPAVDLSIIIVNWNSARYVRQCLATVYARTREPRFEIVVVDNATKDGCGEMLGREFPEAVFIQSAENLGFARANNLGFEKARGGTLLFLNPDTELHSPAIPILYQALWKLPRAGAVGAKLLNTDGTIQTSCIQSFPTLLNKILDAEALRVRWPRAALWGMAPLFTTDVHPAPVDVISGAALMVKREAFERAGKFSEHFFMYAEDVDLCYKIHQAGYQNYLIPPATIVHHGGGSSQQSPSKFSTVMMPESTWRFLSSTQGRGYGMAYRCAMALSAVVRLTLLACLAPFPRASGDRRARVAARSKWRAILLWSLGRMSWVRDYPGGSKPGRLPRTSHKPNA